MNINEADQTYPLICRTNTDNLKRFSLLSFLQQRASIFIMKYYLKPLCLVFASILLNG